MWGLRPHSAPAAHLKAGETLRAIEFRPLDSQLYGFSSLNRLYHIHMLTGAAKPIGPRISEIEINHKRGPRVRFQSGDGQLAYLSPKESV